MTFVNSRQKSSGETLTLDEVSAVSAGGQFSIFLRADGTVYATGNNLFGQLGTGKTESFRGVAQQVLSSSGTALTNITTISAGVSHALAVDENGQAWGWGDNSSGQLGTSVSGTSTNRATKIRIELDVLGVAAGARLGGGRPHGLGGARAHSPLAAPKQTASKLAEGCGHRVARP